MVPPQPASHPSSDYDERSLLHDEFAEMILSLPDVAAALGECLWNLAGMLLELCEGIRNFSCWDIDLEGVILETYVS